MREIHGGQVAGGKKRQYEKGLLDQLSALLTQHQEIQGLLSHHSDPLWSKAIAFYGRINSVYPLCIHSPPIPAFPGGARKDLMISASLVKHKLASLLVLRHHMHHWESSGWRRKKTTLKVYFSQSRRGNEQTCKTEQGDDCQCFWCPQWALWMMPGRLSGEGVHSERYHY